MTALLAALLRRARSRGGHRPATGPLRRTLRLGRTARPRLAAAAATGTASAACAVGLTATAAWLIARAAQHPPVLYLMVAIVAVRAFGIGRGALRYAERLLGHDTALRILAALRVRTYRRLATLAPTGLADTHRADLTVRLVDDIDTLTDLWLRLLLPYTSAALVGAVTLTLTGLLLPTAALTLATTLLAAAVAAPLLASRVSRTAEARIAPQRGAVAAATHNLLDAGTELAAHGALPAALARVDTADTHLTRTARRAATGQGLGAAVATAAAGTATLAALALAAPAVAAGKLTGILATVVVLTPLAAHDIVTGLAPAATAAPRVAGAARRVFTVLDRPDPVTAPAHPTPPPPPPYQLRVDRLHAAWTPGGPDILTGLSLTLPAGSRTVITGASGSGKSTLAAVLLRFLDPTAGTLTLNDTDLTSLDPDAVRRRIGLCAQDVHLFDTTIAANLRIARPDATDRDLHTALAAARLDTFVAALPDGLDTPIGEHGNHLSGGQRQRLALARALLADFPILILDEPTEHLDETTAADLTRDLLAATTGRTVLLLTHRTTATTHADHAYHLTHGRLVPAGGGADLGNPQQAVAPSRR